MEDLLASLNPAQREAVTTLSGPLLIVAGAGTGKTKVLTHRIAHLIETGAFKAEEILALTFTEKATQEMQERLDVLLPYSYGELWVKTFHGFCDAVLRESGLDMGLDTNYTLLTQTDLWLFLREKLFTFELDYYRPLGNPTRFVVAMAEHFSRLRDELVIPDAYVAHAAEALRTAPDEATREEALKMSELARAYAQYDALLLREGVVDFAGLHALTLRLFTEHPSVLRRYRERFRTVLVDEFQDTNTAQNRLVELLAAEHQNLMVVGDDDQSIYKWRGASLANILEFETKFPSCKKVVLTENYRSSHAILDMGYASIQHNNPYRLEAREGLNKRLTSVRGSGGKTPLALGFDHTLDEVRFVIDTIRQGLDSGASARDFAILVRASAHAVPFVDELTREGIPVTFSGAQGLLQREEIKDLVAVLRSVVNPFDDIALFRMLSLPFFGFESDALLRLVAMAKTSSTPLLDLLRKQVEAPDLFSGLSASSGLPSFLNLMDELQNLATTHPASHVLGHFLKATHTLTRLEETPSAEHAEKLQNMAVFSRLIRDFEVATPQNPGVRACMEMLQARQDLGDRMSPPEEFLTNDTVKVLTLHAAKGLEFETVFLTNLVQHRFPSIQRSDPFTIPEALLSVPSEDPHAHLSEERRLFYVGVTRAKSALYLTYSALYGGRKRWKPSVFLEELRDSGAVMFKENPNVSEEATVPVVAATHEPEDKPLIFGLDRAHRSLRLSFSRIDTYEACPLKYKFRYVYSLPEPLSHAASFGSSVHNTLNAFYKELVAGASPSLQRLRALYERHWIPLGYDSRVHLNARKQKGLEILERFFECAEKSSWVVPKYLERPFTLKGPEGLVVSGRIDRIDELTDGTVHVIDYKTGRAKEQKEVDRDLQLSIYALACRDIFHLNVSSLSLYYLESGDLVSTTRTEAQLNQTREELVSIAQTIQESVFEATPSPRVCGFCEYRLLCDKAMA